MAVAYAKSARTHEVYVARAQGIAQSAFNLAVADWFNEPEILAVDISAWNGGIDETIRVQAQDNIHVAKVHVVIRDENNTILEEGDALTTEGAWWTYNTQTVVNISSNPQVTAQAYDLAGNLAEKVAGN